MKAPNPRTLLCTLMLAAPTLTLAASVANGGRLYTMHCAGCHGVAGHAVMPNAPSFAKRDALMQPDMSLANTIRAGKNAMPPFMGVLREQEIRDVIAYLRTLSR